MINVAAAWVCAKFQPKLLLDQQSFNLSADDQLSRNVIEAAWTEFPGRSAAFGGPDRSGRDSISGFGWQAHRFFGVGRKLSRRPVPDIEVDQIHAGWPLRVVTGKVERIRSRDSRQWDSKTTALVNVGGLGEFPTSPIWPSFAINTVFYAVVLWMLFALPRAVRRRVRIRRGQCASCGYSLRESVSEKCPECGIAIAARRADGM